MNPANSKLPEIIVPLNTDYIGIYLTNRCFLSCPYCITNYNEQYINMKGYNELEPSQWIEALNRLKLPPGIPLTLQGGEPLIYKGVWEILENVHHKIDIMTALPPNATPQRFRQLKTLDWNKRDAPYPTIRVSYHIGQNDYKDLVRRIADLQKILSIGLFHIEHPGYPGLTEEIRDYARPYGIEFRTKAFLGRWEEKVYGDYKFPEACGGVRLGKKVKCKNTVFPIDTDGTIYRCHSDLYAKRQDLAIGNITDRDLVMEHKYRDCINYGLCSPCDVKIKTNHLQQDGYTSIDVIFEDE